MIPNESLGKEIYNVRSFGLADVVQLLVNHPCVYYNCSHYSRAGEQAHYLHDQGRRYRMNSFVIFRRVGRRVVAERGPSFNVAAATCGFNEVLEYCNPSNGEDREVFVADLHYDSLPPIMFAEDSDIELEEEE